MQDHTTHSLAHPAAKSTLRPLKPSATHLGKEHLVDRLIRALPAPTTPGFPPALLRLWQEEEVAERQTLPSRK